MYKLFRSIQLLPAGLSMACPALVDSERDVQPPSRDQLLQVDLPRVRSRTISDTCGSSGSSCGWHSKKHIESYWVSLTDKRFINKYIYIYIYTINIYLNNEKNNVSSFQRFQSLYCCIYTCEKPQVRCVVRMALVSIGFLSHRESRAVVIHDPYDFRDSEECE